ncbi:MAG: PAS domain-containing protein, partial [Candidatus Heimdallarchaeaceae archaeon]
MEGCKEGDEEGINFDSLQNIFKEDFIILKLDESFNVEYINKTGCRVFGYEREEVINKNWFDNFVRRDLSLEKKERYKLKYKERETQSFKDSYPVICKNRIEKVVIWDITFVFSKANKLISIVCSGMELTDEFLSIQKKFGLREQNFSSIIYRMELGWVLAKKIFGKQNTITDLEIIDLNAYCERIFGVQKEKIIGKKISKIFSKHKKLIQKRLNEYERSNLLTQGVREDFFLEDYGIWISVLLLSLGENFISLLIDDITGRKKILEIVKQEKEKSELYLKLANVIFVTLDKDMKIVMINKKGCEFLDCKQEEIIGTSWLTFIPKRDQEQIKQIFNKIFSGKTKEIEEYENAIRIASGEERLVAWKNAYLRNDSGEIYAILSSGFDITEQRKLENAFKESEKRYKLLVDIIPDSLFMINKDYQILFANKKACLNLNYEFMENLILKDFTDFVREKEKIKKMFKEIEKPENLVSEKITMISRGGKVIPLEFQISGIYDEQDNFIAFLGLGRDISEKVKLEKEIKESEIKYRTLFNYSIEGYVLATNQGEIFESNTRIKRMLGYSDKELFEGLNIDYLIFENIEKAQKFRKNLEEKGFIHYESNIKKKDGTTIQIEVDSFKIELFDKEAIFCVVRDITERKKMELELKQREELARSMIENS